LTDKKDPIQALVDELRKLPGIGPKSAQRIVFFLLKQPEGEALQLAEAISHLKASLCLCSICNDISDSDPCRICQDDRRDDSQICVVEDPVNVISIEKSGGYQGRYHVLHGTIAPLDGVGPEDLKVENLLPRLSDGKVKEIIVATNPTANGEATALYLARLLKPLDIEVTRIGLGLPVGGDLEYTDSVTISRALAGRRSL
jgi:recombination protein RecR